MNKVTGYFLVLIIGIMLGYAWAAHSYLTRINQLEAVQATWTENWIPQTIGVKPTITPNTELKEKFNG